MSETTTFNSICMKMATISQEQMDHVGSLAKKLGNSAKTQSKGLTASQTAMLTMATSNFSLIESMFSGCVRSLKSGLSQCLQSMQG